MLWGNTPNSFIHSLIQQMCTEVLPSPTHCASSRYVLGNRADIVIMFSEIQCCLWMALPYISSLIPACTIQSYQDFAVPPTHHTSMPLTSCFQPWISFLFLWIIMFFLTQLCSQLLLKALANTNTLPPLPSDLPAPPSSVSPAPVFTSNCICYTVWWHRLLACILFSHLYPAHTHTHTHL